MGPFDILNIMFCNHSKWDSVTEQDKRNNFFIVNRMLSIGYPLQVAALSQLRSDPVSVMNFWFVFISAKHNKSPYWIYTKGSKKQKAKKEQKIGISNDDIKAYSNFYKIETKSIKDAIDLFGDDMIKEIKQFKKIIDNEK